ncbi:MAG: hypothetical protein EOO41_00675 [Methanobacteriota archaeon]|nr:MAG: hypothetical protein EOO41_00675 [Euryarchaeota archaeon]
MTTTVSFARDMKVEEGVIAKEAAHMAALSKLHRLSAAPATSADSAPASIAEPKADASAVPSPAPAHALGATALPSSTASVEPYIKPDPGAVLSAAQNAALSATPGASMALASNAPADAQAGTPVAPRLKLRLGRSAAAASTPTTATADAAAVVTNQTPPATVALPSAQPTPLPYAASLNRGTVRATDASATGTKRPRLAKKPRMDDDEEYDEDDASDYEDDARAKRSAAAKRARAAKGTCVPQCGNMCARAHTLTCALACMTMSQRRLHPRAVGKKEVVVSEAEASMVEVNMMLRNLTKEKQETLFTPGRVERFEIDSAAINSIKYACAMLDTPVPLLQEYDFRHDTQVPNVRMELRDRSSLRPYQEKSLSKMFGNGRARSGIIVLPCGAGKTLVGISAACTIGKSTIILCPNQTSVAQWRGQLERFTTCPAESIRVMTAKQKDKLPDDSSVGVVLLTTYTMIGSSDARRAGDTLRLMQQIRTREWGCMLLDEVHQAVAETFSRALDLRAHCRLGLTATVRPPRLLPFSPRACTHARAAHEYGMRVCICVCALAVGARRRARSPPGHQHWSQAVRSKLDGLDARRLLGKRARVGGLVPHDARVLP